MAVSQENGNANIKGMVLLESLTSDDKESFVLDKPTIFNTRMMHSVPRLKEATGPRWALMMDLFDWPDDLFRKTDQGRIWTDTEHFKYNG